MTRKEADATVATAKNKTGKKRVTFKLEAPEAKHVALLGDFNEWDPAARPLKKNRAGVWSTWTKLPPGRYEYRYLVDGEWVNDPACDELVCNQFGTENSVLHV